MARTTIYLVRHAHAAWRSDDRRPLSESGYEAARDLADCLSDVPIDAIYSSPFRRSVETVAPLAERLRITVHTVDDLRERELPEVPPGEFERAVERTWQARAEPIAGAESNASAQARGLAVLRELLGRHDGKAIVVATHGTLLTLMLNGLDATFGFDFWRRLSFPDVYRLQFEDGTLVGVQRVWR